ncbi:MAG: hypothetical protein GXP08_07050 [Gammaproteobacteria bacterium]|nr:hypothetical protein [Gammaproteobacteria bacterium]
MVHVLLIILVYILGPALILVWAVKRYRSGVKPDVTEVVAVVLAIVLISLLIYSYSSTVTDDDRGEIQQIVDTLVERYPFPTKAKFKDQVAVFGDAEGRNLVIKVYGVIDTIEQEKIVAIVQKLRRQWDSKPIIVKFFQEEIWEQGLDGSRMPARHKEHLIHKYQAE